MNWNFKNLLYNNYMAVALFGSCSWKYPSWKGLIYSKDEEINYLKEYSRKYSTVEIDQWFWSLFGTTSVSLPKRETVSEYLDSVPDNFRFTVKVPNSITLTHFYKKPGESSLKPNPFFLSEILFKKFLASIEPLKPYIGALLLQFEYLNKKKMTSQSEFLARLYSFFSKIPRDYHYALEPRNPQYLNKEYFFFLKDQHLSHVFLEGYYMPPIIDVFHQYGDYIEDVAVIRLHGNNRKGIEEKTEKRWDRIVEPKDRSLQDAAEIVKALVSRGVDVFVNVNNHYEGSAPLTMNRLSLMMNSDEEVYSAF